jgi:hypothetical protein
VGIREFLDDMRPRSYADSRKVKHGMKPKCFKDPNSSFRMEAEYGHGCTLTGGVAHKRLIESFLQIRPLAEPVLQPSGMSFILIDATLNT